MKEDLIEYLKSKKEYFSCVQGLWGYSKEFFKKKGIEAGGGYSSTGSDIGIIYRDGKELKRFRVSLKEVGL